MHDGALLRGQFSQRRGERGAESAFIGFSCRREERHRLLRQSFMMFVAASTPANQVDRQIMSQVQQKSPLVADAHEQLRLPHQFNEQLLEYITGIRLITSEVQQEGK